MATLIGSTMGGREEVEEESDMILIRSGEEVGAMRRIKRSVTELT